MDPSSEMSTEASLWILASATTKLDSVSVKSGMSPRVKSQAWIRCGGVVNVCCSDVLEREKKMSTIISIILRIGKVASVFDLFEFSQASKQILLPIWPEKEKSACSVFYAAKFKKVKDTDDLTYSFK